MENLNIYKFIATEEAKEYGITIEDMEDEYNDLIQVLDDDDDRNDYPEQIVKGAPKLGQKLLVLLPLKGKGRFSKSLMLSFEVDENLRIAAKMKVKGDENKRVAAKMKAEAERLKKENEAFSKIGIE